MNDRFSKIISVIISIAIIVVIAVFGLIIWNQFKNTEETVEPEEFLSQFTVTSNTTENVETPPIQIVERQANEEVRETPTENYDKVQINKYLYNQLDDAEKNIYKAFEENKEEMKTGKASINFGTYFSDLLNTQNGENILQKYYQTAVEAYTYDNPDVFYLDPTKMYLNIATTTYSTGEKAFQVYIDNGNKPNYLINEFSSRDQVNNALLQVEQIKNQILGQRTGNTLNDIKMVHDYLIDTVEYDETVSKENIYNMYGALINRVCVCEGYARAFKYILEDMGVPCILRVGTGTNAKGQTERHAWNYVQFGGKWYAVDVTWDDPVVIGNGRVSESEKTKYFMKTGAEFNSAHVPSNSFTEGGKEFQFPEI